MPDTELTVSQPLVVTVALEGLGFNGVVEAIARAAAQACGELLGRAFGPRTPGYQAALRALCRGRLGEVRSLLGLRGVGERRAVCQEVRTYLERHAAILWTHAEWQRGTAVRKMGSGAIEKTVETQINRRMKRQGMSWSPHGARRLAKLRVLHPDGPRWQALWARFPCETAPPASSRPNAAAP